MSVWCSFLFVLPLSMCFFLVSVLSLPLFYHDGLSVCGSRESAPGSWCDEVMRRDVVIQQFQPKGHICSLSFAVSISVCISLAAYFALPLFISLFIYWICTLLFLSEYQWVYSPPKYPSERIILDCWLFDMTHTGRFFSFIAGNLTMMNATQMPCSQSLSFNWLVFGSILISQQLAKCK